MAAIRAPARFIIDEDLELQAIDQSKATVRYSRHTLEGKEIRAHLSAGKYVTRLGLTWNDRISFVLTDKLQIKRLDFLGKMVFLALVLEINFLVYMFIDIKTLDMEIYTIHSFCFLRDKILDDIGNVHEVNDRKTIFRQAFLNCYKSF